MFGAFLALPPRKREKLREMAFLRLLLVESDPVRAARIAALLSSGNLDVATVATGEEARSALATRQFDVVLASTAKSVESLLLFESPEKNGAVPALVVWGDRPDARDALTVPATVPEQELAVEILRLYRESASRREGSSDALPVFDPIEFRSQMGGDETLIREIVGLFFEDSVSQLQDIRATLDGGDCQTASRLAHSLKGALGSLRSERGRHCAGLLEMAAAAGDEPGSKSAFAALEKTMDALALELRAMLAA